MGSNESLAAVRDDRLRQEAITRECHAVEKILNEFIDSLLAQNPILDAVTVRTAQMNMVRRYRQRLEAR